MKANLGMERETAHNLLMQMRPELFRDPLEPGTRAPRMEKEDSVRKKQAAIREEIDKKRESEPHLTFPVAFNRLMAKKPELFNFEALKERILLRQRKVTGYRLITPWVLQQASLI
jgi:hypothetical protein